MESNHKYFFSIKCPICCNETVLLNGSIFAKFGDPVSPIELWISYLPKYEIGKDCAFSCGCDLEGEEVEHINYKWIVTKSDD